MSEVRTFLDGTECKQYKKLNELVDKIEEYFIHTTEYVGLPSLPEFWADIYKLYNDTNNDEERKLMFAMVCTKLLGCYKYWAVDKDTLWTTQGLDKHNEFVNMYKKFEWKGNGRNWYSYF